MEPPEISMTGRSPNADSHHRWVDNACRIRGNELTGTFEPVKRGLNKFLSRLWKTRNPGGYQGLTYPILTLK